MWWQATVHILIRGADTQDEACEGVSELLSHAPLFVADWAYPRDSTGHVLLPIPRPDLKALGHGEGNFVSASETQYPCPHCTEPVRAEMHYDQDGYSELVLWCPNCGAQQVIKNIPPEESFNGS